MTGVSLSLTGFRLPPRVQFDPNGLAPGEPQYHVVTRDDVLDDLDQQIFPGEPITVVLEGDDDEPDLIGTAHVVRVNDAHGLIYLDVDADSFHEEGQSSGLPWWQLFKEHSLATVSGGVDAHVAQHIPA